MQAVISIPRFPERGKPSAVAWVAVAFVTMAAVLSHGASAVVIYDDFDGNSAGWSTSWTQIYSFVEPSPINGKAMRVSARGGFAVTSAARRFPTITEGVVYVSVLAHAEDLFPLERDSFSAGFDFTLGPTPAPSHPTNLPAWGLGYANNSRSLYLSGSGSGPAIADDVTYRLVTRISKGASGNFEHTDLWKDPVSEADTVTLSGSLAGGVSGINSFVARAQNPRGNSYFDEVVIGNSFAEVVYFQGDAASVATGMGVSVGLLGGSNGNVGGLDVEFDDITAGGDLSAQFERIDAAAFEARFGVAPDLSGIAIPGQETFSIWDLTLPGGEFGTAQLQLQFAANDLPAGFDETRLALWHFNAGLGEFEPLPTLGIDSVADILSASTADFSTFVLGAAVPLPGGVFLFAPALAGILAMQRRRSDQAS